MNRVIELERVEFRRAGQTILGPITCTLSVGRHTVLLGPNGAGKSTLVNIIAALDWASAGTVRVLGETYGRVNLRDFRRRLGLFQPAAQAGLPIHHPSMTALDVILTGLDGSLAVYRDYGSSARAKARELFELLDPQDSLRQAVSQPFGTLSSGERRKALLLRVLMGRPELLILDEPFESLDIAARLRLERLLDRAIAEFRPTVLIVLHRAEEIPTFCTEALQLKSGRLHAHGPLEETMHDDVVSALYGIQLSVSVSGGRFAWFPPPKPADFPS